MWYSLNLKFTCLRYFIVTYVPKSICQNYIFCVVWWRFIQNLGWCYWQTSLLKSLLPTVHLLTWLPTGKHQVYGFRNYALAEWEYNINVCKFTLKLIYVSLTILKEMLKLQIYFTHVNCISWSSILDLLHFCAFLSRSTVNSWNVNFFDWF